jgi:microcin C transport system permease protein
MVLPIVANHPEKRFGGDFLTPTDWNDPFIHRQFSRDGNFAVYTLNPYSAQTVNYFNKTPAPAPPSSENVLGTDESGRDMLARLIYGFRISIWFGVALTLVGVLLGVLVGALQGYFGGRVDLAGQRLIEIWNAIPELYLLIIIASLFEPTLLLVLLVLALFGWVGLSDYVRAEFLRNRHLEFVRAARALGLSNGQIMWRHVLPNSMTPVITFLPFRMSAAILGLAALEFLGLGPANVPSLGDLLRQGKENLDAWWISVPTFILLVLTLLLLTFIGDALRDAFDTRKS